MPPDFGGNKSTKNMLKYEIGKPCPVPVRPGIAPTVVGQSFDVYAAMPNPSYEEKLDWKKGPLQYAIYIENSIAFVAFSLGKSISFDVTPNVMTPTFLASESARNNFLDGAGNLVNLYLIDSATPRNILAAIRSIGFEYAAMDAIRAACRKQVERYGNFQSFSLAADQIQRRLSTADILRKGRVYTT